MKIMKQKEQKRDQGFTIVELMVALSVLSVILVMATVVLINIGGLYSKGVNQANLQNTARNILTDVSNAVQYSGTAPLLACASGGSGSCGTLPYSVACIGNVRYTYFLGTTSQPAEIGDTINGKVLQHVLWRDTMVSPSASCTPLDLTQTSPSASGYEMVPVRTELTRFAITPIAGESGTYSITVTMASGPEDIPKINPDGSVSCNTVIGDQYCATSDLTTSVTRALN